MHENDQFRQIDFLNTALIHSNYIPIDAELHAEFFEPICMFVARFIIELLTKKTVEKSSTKFYRPNTDAELRAELFELTLMFVTHFILDSLMKKS